jgi:hypothetical protein
MAIDAVLLSELDPVAIRAFSGRKRRRDELPPFGVKIRFLGRTVGTILVHSGGKKRRE